MQISLELHSLMFNLTIFHTLIAFFLLRSANKLRAHLRDGFFPLLSSPAPETLHGNKKTLISIRTHALKLFFSPPTNIHKFASSFLKFSFSFVLLRISALAKFSRFMNENSVVFAVYLPKMLWGIRRGDCNYPRLIQISQSAGFSQQNKTFFSIWNSRFANPKCYLKIFTCNQLFTENLKVFQRSSNLMFMRNMF